MVAAAWKNEGLFRRMVADDSASVGKTLFHAAKLPDPNTIRVSGELNNWTLTLLLYKIISLLDVSRFHDLYPHSTFTS